MSCYGAKHLFYGFRWIINILNYSQWSMLCDSIFFFLLVSFVRSLPIRIDPLPTGGQTTFYCVFASKRTACRCCKSPPNFFSLSSSLSLSFTVVFFLVISLSLLFRLTLAAFNFIAKMKQDCETAEKENYCEYGDINTQSSRKKNYSNKKKVLEGWNYERAPICNRILIMVSFLEELMNRIGVGKNFINVNLLI